jgi:hypothetical protein
MPEDKPAGTEPMIEESAKPVLHSCNDCGLMFKSQEYLDKHICPTNISECDMDTDEEDVFTDLVKEALEENNNDWEKLYDQYKDKGEEKAMKRANREILPDDVESFRDLYSTFHTDTFKYNKSKLHRGIVENIEDLVCVDMPIKKAIERTLDENAVDITGIVKSQERFYESGSSSDSSRESSCESSGESSCEENK